MLEPDPDVRPDIYQVAIVAFALAGRKCSVGNLNVRGCSPKHHIRFVVPFVFQNSQAPSLDEIRQLKALHDARQISAAARLPSPSAQYVLRGCSTRV